jgi:ELWxxDGT repeat protein
MDLSRVVKTLVTMTARTAPMLLMAVFAHGQTLSYVPNHSTDFASVGSVNFFAASDALHGVELWRSDGTAGGTYRISDIAAGPSGSNPQNLTAVNGLVFFAANDGVSGIELWCSDGSSEGTRLVSDINPGAGSSSPQQLIGYAGYLYFFASNGAGSPALWRSDGTAAGTIPVSNLGGSTPLQMSVVGSTLQILTNDTSAGYENWISDGTAAGTVLASPTPPVSATVSWTAVTSTSVGTPLMNLGGYKIYFGASPIALTSIIDVPDPTVSSYMVPNLTPGTLYFAVTAYTSDGVESGLSTIVVAALN